MLGKNIAIKGIVTTILFITMGISQVSLEIKNVDTSAGTLDIYMTNATACSYCPDSTYNNNSDTDWTWVTKKDYCELSSAGDTTWVAYDNSYTEAECWNTCSGAITESTCTGADNPAVTNFPQPTNEADCLDPAGDNNDTGTPGNWVASSSPDDIQPISESECLNPNSDAAGTPGTGTPGIWSQSTTVPSITGNGGWWFDGKVSGFQFVFSGVTVIDATAPTGFITYISDSTVVGFSLTGETISVGSDVLLTQVSFTTFLGSGICFGEDTGSAGNTVISGTNADASSLYVSANWGPCYDPNCPSGIYDCADDCDGSAVLDCAGVCGGGGIQQECGCGISGEFGIPDGHCDCDGSAVLDCAGVCGGDATTAECAACTSEVFDCVGTCDGMAVVDCAGVCDGSAVLDCAGVCGGDATTAECAACTSAVFDCEGTCDGMAVVDCAGVCDGSAVLDCAGVCGGDATTADCAACTSEVFDCAGTCDGMAVVDCAGVCDGSAVLDCAGTCDGMVVVDCAGACDGSAVLDCAGVCGGDATTAECAACTSAVFDCAGVCGGDAILDSEGNCTVLAISQISFYLPDEFSISQNYPNPFNPITSITFDVAEMDEVSLIVYDLTGKEVATLVSGIYAPGTYNLEWNAVNNSGDGIVSGMYIYRYISSEKAITRKMLYLK